MVCKPHGSLQAQVYSYTQSQDKKKDLYLKQIQNKWFVTSNRSLRSGPADLDGGFSHFIDNMPSRCVRSCPKDERIILSNALGDYECNITTVEKRASPTCGL